MINVWIDFITRECYFRSNYCLYFLKRLKSFIISLVNFILLDLLMDGCNLRNISSLCSFLMRGCNLRDISCLCSLECWWVFILSLVWECTFFLLDKKKVQKKNQDYVVAFGLYLRSVASMIGWWTPLLCYLLITNDIYKIKEIKHQLIKRSDDHPKVFPASSGRGVV